jgi:pSer/pThr/pTyr-binding forkhead associated (FHA) protein
VYDIVVRHTMPALRVLVGPHTGTLIPLVAESVSLGRGPHCDVVIPMIAVSRNHARIVRVRDAYLIEDTESRSGTRLNDVTILYRRPLRNGDRIRICDFVAVYLDEPFSGLSESIEALELDQGTVAAVLEPSYTMTQQDWLTSDEPNCMLLSIAESAERLELIRRGADPTLALNFPRGPALHRKLRLFVWACARRVWHVLERPVNKAGIEAAERHAEGMVADDEREKAYKQEMRRRGVGEPYISYYAYRERSNVEHHAAREAARAVEAILGGRHQKRRANERVALASLLQDLFWPFREVTVDPAWLAWENGLVGRLARAAYDERCLPEGTLEGARLAVLADALEDAGCTNTELFEHLRGPGVHIRGCWAVDLLMENGG